MKPGSDIRDGTRRNPQLSRAEFGMEGVAFRLLAKKQRRSPSERVTGLCGCGGPVQAAAYPLSDVGFVKAPPGRSPESRSNPASAGLPVGKRFPPVRPVGLRHASARRNHPMGILNVFGLPVPGKPAAGCLPSLYIPELC